MQAGIFRHALLASAALIFAPQVAAQSVTPAPDPAADAATQASTPGTPQEAATTAQAEVAQSSGLEDIIVTAQRRSENQQSVPIAVTTLTAAALKDSGVSASEGLATVTPGLVLTTRSGAALPFLRGVGSQNTAPGSESSIATYVDGVYYMSPTANVFSFNNIERVEVLKGPQGTLFGRNATGGLINVITRDPKVAPSIEGSASYGNYDTYEGSVYATGGKGDVAADIAGYIVRQNDGWGRNLTTGAEVSKRNETAVRGKVQWKPTDHDTVTLSGDWSTNKSDIGRSRNILPGAFFIGGGGFKGTAYDSQANFNAFVSKNNFWGASARVVHDFSFATLSILAAYRNLHIDYGFDQDGGPLRVADALLTEDSRTFQTEAVLVGDVGRLNWTVGGNYFTADSLFNPLGIRSSLAPSSNYNLFARQQTYSLAGFAQGTYAVTDTTKVTAGVRYTSDEREYDARQVAAPGNSAPVGSLIGAAVNSHAHFPKVTWRFAIDQKLAEHILLFGSVSRGFKSGEYNLAAIAVNPVRPETLDAYEVGLKSELFDRQLRFNVSGFHYDYKDIQLFRLNNGVTQLLNAAAGRINGADIESTFAPHIGASDLQITAGVSILDGKYKNFPEGVRTTPRPTGGNVQTPNQNLSGNKMVQTPDWTSNIGVNYTVPIGSNEVSISGNYFHSDGFYWEADNRIKQNAYDLLNAQVAFRFGNDHQYALRVFGKNLTKTLYYSYVVESGLGDLAAPAAPRTYGVAFDFKF